MMMSLAPGLPTTKHAASPAAAEIFARTEYGVGVIPYAFTYLGGIALFNDESTRGMTALKPEITRVLTFAAAGFSNAEMSDVLGMSSETLKTQISTGMKKLGVNRRAQVLHAMLSPEHNVATLAAPIDPDSLAVYSERQKEVMAAIVTQGTNEAIATHLYISPSTVKTHLQDIAVISGTGRRELFAVGAVMSGMTGLSLDILPPKHETDRAMMVHRYIAGPNHLQFATPDSYEYVG